MKYILVVKRGQNGFPIGQLKEFPDVFMQRTNLAELKENTIDALEVYLEDLRETAINSRY
ncbi:MAG: hypothetical protein LBF19_00765 [Prevotellaceae bacterium]|nr:hypothetical protein [Prevotellaceae bacterium]